MVPESPCPRPKLVHQLRAIMLLPFMVAVVVPAVLSALAGGPEFIYSGSFVSGVRLLLGCLSAVVGLILLISTVVLFHYHGGGTLVPWDAPCRLVVRGPYRWVRNPMISGVAGIVLSEALLAGSWLLAAWFGVFVLANALWIPLWEEPGLERRFGEPYRLYKSQVPRWMPRLTPWAAPANRH